MIKYNIQFKRTAFRASSASATYSKEYEFNDDKHFSNWLNKQYQDESYRKIIGYERVYSEEKLFSNSDAKKMWIDAITGKFSSFEEWYKFQFKKDPE